MAHDDKKDSYNRGIAFPIQLIQVLHSFLQIYIYIYIYRYWKDDTRQQFKEQADLIQYQWLVAGPAIFTRGRIRHSTGIANIADLVSACPYLKRHAKFHAGFVMKREIRCWAEISSVHHDGIHTWPVSQHLTHKDILKGNYSFSPSDSLPIYNSLNIRVPRLSSWTEFIYILLEYQIFVAFCTNIYLVSHNVSSSQN